MAFDYNKLVERYFVRGADGYTAWYPRGSHQGYWIDTAEREISLRAATLRYVRLQRFWGWVLTLPLFAPILSPPHSRSIVLIYSVALIALLGIVQYGLWRLVATRLSTGLVVAPRREKVPYKLRQQSAVGALSYKRLIPAALVLPALAFWFTTSMAKTPIKSPGPIAADGVLWLLTLATLFLLILKIRMRGANTTPSPEMMFARRLQRPRLIVSGVLVVFFFGLAIFQAARTPMNRVRPSPAQSYASHAMDYLLVCFKDHDAGPGRSSPSSAILQICAKQANSQARAYCDDHPGMCVPPPPPIPGARGVQPAQL